MKKSIIILTLLLMPFLIFAQSWNYKSGGNAFDGKYKTASIKGVGDDYPYHKPTLVINMYNNEVLNFYIAGAGYYQSLSDVKVLWIFNNDPNTIYSSYNFSKSRDGKIIFFDNFKNDITDEILSELDFINKLKTASKVNIRIKNEYGKNDLTFSLIGSTKAIDYVISKKYIQEINSYRESIIEELNVMIEIKVDLGMLLLDKGVYEFSERKKLIDIIFDNLDNNYPLIKSIDSLEFKLLDRTTELYLFSNNKLIDEINFIEEITPLAESGFRDELLKTKAEILKNKLEAFKPLLSELNLSEFEENNIIDELEFIIRDIKIEDIVSVELKVNLKTIGYTDEVQLILYGNDIQIITINKADVPSYFEKILSKTKDKAIQRIKPLLYGYGISESEGNNIINNIDDFYLYKIESENVNNLLIELAKKDINFLFLHENNNVYNIRFRSLDSFSKKTIKEIKKINKKSSKNR